MNYLMTLRLSIQRNCDVSKSEVLLRDVGPLSAEGEDGPVVIGDKKILDPVIIEWIFTTSVLLKWIQ